MIASPGAAAVSIVGAGPTGALLALLLRRRGFAVTAFDGRPDPRGLPAMSGRSINLALADRGIHALKSAGVYDRIAGAMVPMRGRLLHQTGAEPAFQPYGGREGEAIYSISRHRLNQALLEAAAAAGVELKFEHRLEDLDVDAAAAHIHDARGARRLTVPMNPLLAADGAGSTSRRRLAALELVKADEVDLEHGYKELTIPAGPAGRFAMRSDALHIWPRGNFMLIALPNATAASRRRCSCRSAARSASSRWIRPRRSGSSCSEIFRTRASWCPTASPSSGRIRPASSAPCTPTAGACAAPSGSSATRRTPSCPSMVRA